MALHLIMLFYLTHIVNVKSFNLGSFGMMRAIAPSKTCFQLKNSSELVCIITPPMMQKLLADVLAQALTSGVLEGQIQLEADGEDVIARIPRAWFRAHGGERLLDVGT